MSKFAYYKLAQVREGPIKFYQLSENGKSRFEEFCNMIEKEGNLKCYLTNIWSVMDRMAVGHEIPENIVRPIKRGNKGEYEIKKGSLRVYFIKDPVGNIIITGGKKTTQERDIAKFQSIHQEYLNSKKNEK